MGSPLELLDSYCEDEFFIELLIQCWITEFKLLCLVPAGLWDLENTTGQRDSLCFKAIGLKSMHSFICRLVPYITLIKS